MKHENLNAGGLFYAIDTERFLFLLRNNSSYSNTWGFVGGSVEIGETPYQGLLREVNEEIGFNPDIVKVIPLELFTSTNKYFIYHTFVLLVDTEFMPILNNEHNGYAWVTIDGWPSPLHPGVFSTLKLDTIKSKIKTIIDTNKF